MLRTLKACAAIARLPKNQSANTSTAQAVYRQGMGDAVADGLAKAQFLAGKLATPLGAVQSVVEEGGYISCPGEAEYLGSQPDFGTAMEGAQEVIEQFSNANGSWPFYAGRFIRPDLIVSVDVVDA